MPGVRISSSHPIDAIASAASVADQGDVAEVAVADPVPQEGGGDSAKSEPDHAAILKPAKKNNK